MKRRVKGGRVENVDRSREGGRAGGRAAGSRGPGSGLG